MKDVYYKEPSATPEPPQQALQKVGRMGHQLQFCIGVAATAALVGQAAPPLTAYLEQRDDEKARTLIEGLDQQRVLFGVELNPGYIMALDVEKPGQLRAKMAGRKGNYPVYMYYPTANLLCRMPMSIADIVSPEGIETRVAKNIKAGAEHGATAVGRLCTLPDKDIKAIIDQITTTPFAAPPVQAAAAPPGPFSVVAKNGATVMEQRVVEPKIVRS